MKTITSKLFAALIAATTTTGISSCGLPQTANAQETTQTTAQSGIGSLLGALTSSGAMQQIGGLISNALVPTEQQIIGTWVYQSPAIVFNSENALASIGGNLASSTVESKLQSYLNKYGIKAGNTTLQFNSDKTFAFTISGKQIGGTYAIVNNKIQLTFTGMAQASGLTPQLDNGSLIIAGDATKIKNFLQGLAASANRTELNTISSLMGQFNGMQMGIRLQKK